MAQTPILRLLLVDDDQPFRTRLGRALTDRGKQVTLAASAVEALRLLSEQRFDAVVTDLKMPGDSGLAVVEQACRLNPSCRAVVLTGYGAIATAVGAMRLGAQDYLVKPCNADQLLAALEQKRAEEEAEELLGSRTPSLARLEREHIERVLVECGGNVSKAARVLGINRRTLQYKLAKYPVSQ